MEFIDAAHKILNLIEETQSTNISRAASIFAETIAGGGVVHVFGSGHSRIGVEELFPRIGSFVGFNPMVELSLSYFTNIVGGQGVRQSFFLEQVPGFAEEIIRSHDISSRDAALVISSSGVNAVPVEMAIGFKYRSVPVVAVTSVQHSSRVQPKNPAGQRLMEVADIVIDNCTPLGDAVVSLAGCSEPIGATSTLALTAVIQSLNVSIAEELLIRDFPLSVMTSPHIDDTRAAKRNREDYLQAYLLAVRRAPTSHRSESE